MHMASMDGIAYRRLVLGFCEQIHMVNDDFDGLVSQIGPWNDQREFAQVAYDDTAR